MVILHIAHLNNNRFAGVNIAVRSLLFSQSKMSRVAVLNVSDNVSLQTEYEYLYSEYKDISALPKPFDAPDLIVFHEIYYPRYLKLYPMAVRRKIPYIIVPHGGMTRQAQSVKAMKKSLANFLLFKRFMSFSCGIQYLSEKEFSQSKFEKYKEKAFVQPNGVNCVCKNEKTFDSVLKIVYVGRLDIYIKGIDLLLEGVKICKDELEKSGCVIELYGPDEEECHSTIFRLIKSLGIENTVSLHGAVSGRRKDEVLKNADCFIQTSRSEGMSIGILEAFSYGLPCILSDGTSMKALLLKYDAGWATDTSATGIAKALSEAISSNRETLRAKSLGAVRLTEENFMMEKVTKDTLCQYKKVVAEFNGDC